jgi:hypothetical protein
LWEDYGTDIWFIARRNGRFHTYTTTDEPSPGPETLVYLPSSIISQIINFYLKGQNLSPASKEDGGIF